MLTKTAWLFGLLGVFALAACQEDHPEKSFSGTGFLRDAGRPTYFTTITLDNGEELEGYAIEVRIWEKRGTDISIIAETGDGAAIHVTAMDTELFLQGTWETAIGLRDGLAVAQVGDAVVPAGVVRYNRTGDRITGTVENDLDAPSNFPPEIETTELGMSFDGIYSLSCSVIRPESEGHISDEDFESPFCQQFAHLRTSP